MPDLQTCYHPFPKVMKVPDQYNKWIEFTVGPKLAVLYSLLMVLFLVLFFIIFDILLLIFDFYMAFIVAVVVPVVVTVTYGVKKGQELKSLRGRSTIIFDPEKMDKFKTEILIEDILRDLKLEYDLSHSSIVHGKFLMTDYAIKKFDYKIHLVTYSPDKKKLERIELSVGPPTEENRIYVDQIKKEILQRVESLG
jgi:hypothetical protein